MTGHLGTTAGIPATPAAERAALVELCIDLADRLRTENPALHGRLRRGLAAAGVTAVEPDGEAFDRHHHDAVDVEPAPSADRDRIVASTERLGFVDRGAVVRRPEVVVYAWEEGERVEH